LLILYGGFATAEVWVDEVNDLEVTTFLPIVMPTTVAEMISAAEFHCCSFKAYVQPGFTFKKFTFLLKMTPVCSVEFSE
jgi:hypothetical protein